MSSSCLQMPLDILAMGHSGMVIALVCHGLQTSSTNPLSGRNCMLSLLLVEPGASTGRGNGRIDRVGGGRAGGMRK